MPRLARLQPVSPHPEVPYRAYMTGAAAKCTMAALAGKEANETISYNESPYTFGKVSLEMSPRNEPFLFPSISKVPIFLRYAPTLATMLDFLASLMDDAKRDRAEVADTCRALKVLLPDCELMTLNECDAFFHRNANWRDR